MRDIIQGMHEPLLKPGILFPDPDPDAAKSWLSVVHDVARLENARVLGGMDQPSVDRNFYAVPVDFRAGSVTILFNSGARLVACVEGVHPFPATARYVRVPSPDSFATIGLTVATPADMEATLYDHHLGNLDAEETDQVRYHRPRRIGDVLFNWFD